MRHISKTIAFHTLGCKVNQYDTQAMLELFRSAGYEPVPFGGPADIYLINTCTVTGTGDRKSLQLARRVRRERPESDLILCGCLAQRLGQELLEETGACLVLGTQRRAEVVRLYEQAVREGSPVCAVDALPPGTPYEPLRVTGQSEHTRATLKIQEGCSNRCTYCVIHSVRGPIRSRAPDDVAQEARALAEAGYQELVVTGIHLTSYGLDQPGRPPLTEVLERLQAIPSVRRIRLGSLEPSVATPAFARALRDLDKVCPQFHLALQSGSDTVLRRMARRYTAQEYLRGVDCLREAFPDAAFTTDILTGFPGETREEYQATRDMMERVGYARVHVFPFSPRAGTPAAGMPGQLSRAVKEERARELIALGEALSRRYRETWLGRTAAVLAEEAEGGAVYGYTPEYIRVRLEGLTSEVCGRLLPVRLTALSGDGMTGEPAGAPNP